MRRFFSLLLIGIFSFSALDAPPLKGQQIKSCCCVAKKHDCKFAHHLSCPLKNESGASGARGIASPSANQSKTVLDPFGCGSREEHMASPAFSKEFCTRAAAGNHFFVTPDFLVHQPALKFAFLFSGRIERPPITAHFL